MANEFNYEAVFGADFATISSQLALMPDKVEAMLLGIIDSMVFDAENFAASLEQTTTLLSANRIDSKTILSTLKADHDGAGRIFGKLKNDIKGGLAMATSHSGRLGQYEDFTNKDLFNWVTVGGHRICADCEGRPIANPQTYKIWEEAGLPGSGWSVCKGYCYCVLDPSGKISDNIQGVVVREKGA
jgi:hypothetical protein